LCKIIEVGEAGDSLGKDAPGSREFYRYVALVQDYFDTAVKAAHRKLIAGAEISA
jgi:hypothetical protein